MFADIVGHGLDRIEHLFSLSRILQLDAVILVQEQDNFQRVDRIEPETVVPEKRSFRVNVLRRNFFKIQSLNELGFKFSISSSIISTIIRITMSGYRRTKSSSLAKYLPFRKSM